jgi:hypothetical protein
MACPLRTLQQGIGVIPLEDASAPMSGHRGVRLLCELYCERPEEPLTTHSFMEMRMEGSDKQATAAGLSV